MRPGSRRWTAVAAVVLVVVLGAAFAVAALRRPGQASIRVTGPPVTVQKGLSPREPQFGDTVTATVVAVVDPRRVDPASVRVQTSFAPYRVVSTTRSERQRDGVTIVTVEHRLHCLEPACVPPGAGGSLRFADAMVEYTRAGTDTTFSSAWPALRVHSRLGATDLQRPFLRVPPARPAAVDYRFPPQATGYVLLGLATLLALVGAATILGVGLRRGLMRRRRPVPPLERILAELDAASSNGDSGRRRRALEHLARELQPLDESLSAESRVLAWAPDDPRPDAIADLTTRVLAAVGR